MQSESKVLVHYHCPEDYPDILARMVFAAKVKENDPFAIDPDRSYPGLIIENHPLRSLQDLGFTFPLGSSVAFHSSIQTLLVDTDLQTQKDLVEFHTKLGIKIEKMSNKAEMATPRKPSD